MKCPACEENDAASGHDFCPSCLKAYNKQRNKDKEEAWAERQKKRKRLYDKVRRCWAALNMAKAMRRRLDLDDGRTIKDIEGAPKRDLLARQRKADRVVKDRQDKLNRATDALFIFNNQFDEKLCKAMRRNCT